MINDFLDEITEELVLDDEEQVFRHIIEQTKNCMIRATVAQSEVVESLAKMYELAKQKSRSEPYLVPQIELTPETLLVVMNF